MLHFKAYNISCNPIVTTGSRHFVTVTKYPDPSVTYLSDNLRPNKH